MKENSKFNVKKRNDNKNEINKRNYVKIHFTCYNEKLRNYTEDL